MTKPDLTCRAATTMAFPLAEKLSETGKRLKKPRFSKEYLLKTLEQAVTYLAEVDQAPSEPILASLTEPMHALVMPKILRHHDNDVKILVATCISEIMRITAPEVLYNEDILKEIFELIVATFRGLDEIHSPSFGRRVTILETVARVRLFVIMLDLQCEDLILEMFYVFFSRVREDHSEKILASMQTILTDILNESDSISDQLLSILLNRLRRENGDISPAAYRLAMNVMKCVAMKIEPNVNLFLTSVMLAERKFENDPHNYHDIIFNIYQCEPQILRSIIPNLTQQLLSESSDVRLNSVKLLGRIFALPGHALAKEFRPLLSEFLKRFTDNFVDVRLAAVKYAKECVLSNPFRPESSSISAALSDRLSDSNEAVRKHAIGAICDIANYEIKSIPTEAIRKVADCLHDQTVSVQKYTLERLVEVYRVHCSKCLDGSVGNFEFDWIPGKILGCCYDKGFRSQEVDVAFSRSLFPSYLPTSERVKRWIAMFSEFEKPEIKAFEEVLNQKKRLQVQMQSFLSWREKMKEEDTPELKNKILCCAKSMPRSFKDISKVEESFIQLSQIKDNSIWKALSSLLDSSLTFVQAQLTFDYLLKQLGERHPQYEFMKILAIRCSYLLFGQEHVKEMIKEIAGNALAGKDKIILSSMNLLVLFARFFPSLFDGAEKDMLQLLKDDNDHIKEGMVHILAKTGCTVHEKKIETNGPVDLLLENLCLKGTRKQAKYAVQAIVAIKKDFGLKALSALYKRLVDMLESDEHLATVLQSLGCIAQTAMPIFETQEDDIIKFICRKLLRKSSIPTDISETGWNDRSKECFLKICGIKTLVRSYLPYRDAHLRQRIKALFGVLTKLITTGEISEEVQSSNVDKSHIRLAAAKAVLRLSRQWDCHINPQLFHVTLRTAQDICPHVRKQFLAKVHRYLKDRNLHHKYACAFVLSTARGTDHDLLEARQYMAEFVETCQDTQLHQSSLQLDCNSCTCSPELVLSYLIHTLAHHPDFSVSNKSLCAEAFEPFYRQLHFFLSVILHQDQCKTHDLPKRNKVDNSPLIMTVFWTIMQMEDAVDKSKSKNLYALCDLGLLITKEFAQSQINTGSETISISLPGLYCRTSEGSGDAHLKGNPDEKLSNKSLYENSPKDCESLESEKPPGQSKSRIIEVVSNEVISAPENVLITVAEALVLPERKQGRPYENGPKDGESLEFERPSEQHEEQSKSRSEAVANEVKSAVNNDMMIVAEVSVLPKRKRGRPFKNGPKDGESLKLEKRSENPSGQSKSRIIEVVPNEVMSAPDNVLITVAEELESEKPSGQSKSRIIEVVPNEAMSAPNNVLIIVPEALVLPERKQGRPYENGPKDGESLEFERPSEQHEERSKSRSEAVPNEVKSAADNVMMTVEEASVLPIRKRGRPCKDGPKYGEGLGFENPSEQHKKKSKNRIREVIPNEVNSAVKNAMMIVDEVSALPKRKRGRPFKNGRKGCESLELEKPSEKHEEQSQSTIEAVLNEVKPAADNIMITVGDISVLPKRKRGRPRKYSVDLASQGNRQSLSGKYCNQLKVSRAKRGCKKSLGCKSESILSGLSREPRMQHNDQLIPRSMTPKQSMCLRKLDIQPACKVERERKRKTSDAVPRKTMVAEVNCTYKTLQSSKRKKRCLHKESSDFPSPGKQQGMLERSKGLKFSQHRGGRPKGSGKRLDCKEKLKLPDLTIMAIERVSDGFSGAELVPYCQPLEENNVSGQNVVKISDKRLDDNHDKLEKNVEKTLRGVQKFSTENESLDPKSEIVCLHKKKPTNRLGSLGKRLNEDGNNHSRAPRKVLRRKSFSAAEKTGSQKLEKKIGEELVGHGIKVWWPKDKKFYAGVVESYDPQYRKHKVIYHDGDVEVLRLSREQWELINGDLASTKVVRTSVRSAKSNGVTPIYKTRSNTGHGNVNSNAHCVLKQVSNACSSESKKDSAERTVDSLVFTDANEPVCFKGH